MARRSIQSEKPVIKDTSKPIARLALKVGAPKAARPRARPAAAVQIRRARKLHRKRRTHEPEAIDIPPILLEGDYPETPIVSGPGAKYLLGPETTPQVAGAVPAHLPASYDTRRLILLPRDPHWVYANWDLPRADQRRFNARSVHGHMVLRVYEERIAGKPVCEIHVHPESHHWFVHVEKPGTSYVAELGYYGRGRLWASIAVSEPVSTPSPKVSAESKARFVTIPLEETFAQLHARAGVADHDETRLADALIEQAHAAAIASQEHGAESAPENWTLWQQAAVCQAMGIHMPFGELAGAAGEPSPSSMEYAASPFAPFRPGHLPEITSSPGGPSSGEWVTARKFWFKVNAELVVYGSTDPNAQVFLGERLIALQPDGSFSQRFSLPDGSYLLQILAVAPEGLEARGVELRFSRTTEKLGDVEAQPPKTGLRPPLAENL